MAVVENRNFTASVDEWVKATEQRMTAVFRESTQWVISLMINGTPVDTGFARASYRVSTSEMPSISASAKGVDGQAYSLDLGNITLAIAGAEIGQTIFCGMTAAYGLPLEYGHSKQAPAGFVRIAAQQWQVIVDQVTGEAKDRAA